MMKDTTKIYSNTFVGLAFDFFSPLSRKKIADKLALSTRMDVTYSGVMAAGVVDRNTIRVMMNEVGGKLMSQVQVGFIPLAESVNVAFKVLDLIDAVGYTNISCRVSIAVMFDSVALGLPSLSNINTLRLVSALDDVVKSTSRKRDIDALACSVSYVYPENMFPKCLSINAHDLRSYKFPSSGLFIVDFDKLRDGMIHVNLPRHKDYQKNKRGFYEQLSNIVS